MSVRQLKKYNINGSLPIYCIIFNTFNKRFTHSWVEKKEYECKLKISNCTEHYSDCYVNLDEQIKW